MMKTSSIQRINKPAGILPSSGGNRLSITDLLIQERQRECLSELRGAFEWDKYVAGQESVSKVFESLKRGC